MAAIQQGQGFGAKHTERYLLREKTISASPWKHISSPLVLHTFFKEWKYHQGKTNDFHQ